MFLNGVEWWGAKLKYIDYDDNMSVIPTTHFYTIITAINRTPQKHKGDK